MELPRSLREESWRRWEWLLEWERFREDLLCRLDERLRLGLRRVETGRLSGLLGGDP